MMKSTAPATNSKIQYALGISSGSSFIFAPLWPGQDCPIRDAPTAIPEKGTEVL
jgi:hypothetical protein